MIELSYIDYSEHNIDINLLIVEIMDLYTQRVDVDTGILITGVCSMYASGNRTSSRPSIPIMENKQQIRTLKKPSYSIEKKNGLFSSP